MDSLPTDSTVGLTVSAVTVSVSSWNTTFFIVVDCVIWKMYCFATGFVFLKTKSSHIEPSNVIPDFSDITALPLLSGNP